jgi:hypothetical protein
MTTNAQVTKQERLLNRVEAAQYLIETWRIPCSVGTEFRKAGRTPLYPQDGLDAYAQSKISRRVRSTSELTISESAHAKMATT